MKNEELKKKYKVKIQQLSPSELSKNSITNEVLSKLGLLPLPENVHATISDDGTYLNLKLKETNNEENKHILYQFPLIEIDYQDLENLPDYNKLMNRYNLYINNYINEIISYAQSERIFLSENFPGLICDMKIRLKSFDSYKSKLVHNLKIGKGLYINDILAERIIISEFNGSSDEAILTEMCYKVAQDLYDFRINTSFRMQTVSDSLSHSDKQYVTKDYIANPKKSNYKSLHLLMSHKDNSDFTYETQIRTQNMEESSKKSELVSHKVYKPRVLNDLSPNRVPIYYDITSFNDEFGNPIIVNIPIENSFYHFYNSDRNLKLSEEDRVKNPAITYKKFISEQNMLESLLGTSFKNIREKLQILYKTQKSKDEMQI